MRQFFWGKTGLRVTHTENKTIKPPKSMRRPSSRKAKEEDIRRDLERFQEKALELGASAAEVIPASAVLVEERVRMKCFVPRCRALRDGGTPYCPPHTPEPDFMRKVFRQYRWAVVFKTDITPLEDYIPTSAAQRREPPPNAERRPGFHDATQDIVDQLESCIQSESYDLALGFSGGSCKGSLCHGAPRAVFQNGSCRFPLRARPSMEAVGIDVFDLASKVGWDIYMIRGTEPDLDKIPCGISVGIVLVD